MQIPLHQKGPSLGELTPLVNDLDANASSGCWWFNNPLLAAAALPGFAQELGVLGQDEGLGEETELLLAKAALHAGQIPPQAVLSPNLEGTWEVV